MKEEKSLNLIAESAPLFMNFSGVYDGMEGAMDFSDISGTGGYCDEAAAEEIRSRIAELPYEGIHFLDSGNYHYLSFFWLEKIKTDFALVLFDHHPDMQPPAFGDILSCGGWVEYAFRSLAHMKEAYLIDVDPGLLCELGELPYNVKAYQRGEILEAAGEDISFGDLPLYLSIDKDVLSEQDVKTDWDQGDMRLFELLQILDIIYEKRASVDVLGIDICGEIRENREKGDHRSRQVNQRLLWYFQEKSTP